MVWALDMPNSYKYLPNYVPFYFFLGCCMLCNRQHSKVSTASLYIFLSSLRDPKINSDDFFFQVFSNESLFLLSQINLICWKVG